MTTHLPNNQTPNERFARYKEFAEAAANSGIKARDAEMSEAFFKMASEWQRLAEEARAELHSASARPFWV